MLSSWNIQYLILFWHHFTIVFVGILRKAFVFIFLQNYHLAGILCRPSDLQVRCEQGFSTVSQCKMVDCDCYWISWRFQWTSSSLCFSPLQDSSIPPGKV